MSDIKSFEDILAWQKSKDLSLAIYAICQHCKDYGFKDQLQRAAVSVMNNIAEGYERNGNKEFRNFLFIAKGSSAEVRSMIRLGQELGYVPRERAEVLIREAIEISKMLSGLIKTLN